MRLIRRMALGLCVPFLAYSAYAAQLPSICGEWTGSRPPNGTTRPNEQKWVLTFDRDKTFGLVIFEDASALPGVEGCYESSETNILIDLFGNQQIPLTYTLREDVLTLPFSEITRQLGWGDGVDKFVRTKSGTNLLSTTHSATLDAGRYRVELNVSDKNKKDVLIAAFGDHYKEATAKPIDVGTCHVYRLKYRNIIKFPSGPFGSPSFDGKDFKVSFAFSRHFTADLEGTTANAKKITGTFRGRQAAVAGTFTVKWASGLDEDTGGEQMDTIGSP